MSAEQTLTNNLAVISSSSKKATKRMLENRNAALASNSSGAGSNSSGPRGSKAKASSSSAMAIDLTLLENPPMKRKTRETRPPSPDRPPQLEGTSKEEAIIIGTSEDEDDITVVVPVPRAYSVHGSDSESAADSESESDISSSEPFIFHSNFIWPKLTEERYDYAAHISSFHVRAQHEINIVKSRLPRKMDEGELKLLVSTISLQCYNTPLCNCALMLISCVVG